MKKIRSLLMAGLMVFGLGGQAFAQNADSTSIGAISGSWPITDACVNITGIQAVNPPNMTADTYKVCSCNAGFTWDAPTSACKLTDACLDIAGAQMSPPANSTRNPVSGNCPCNSGYTLNTGTGSCNAIINGACGGANGSSSALAPSSGLCSTGSPSAVIGTGPWSWTCSGSNGGTNASCSANPSATLHDGLRFFRFNSLNAGLALFLVDCTVNPTSGLCTFAMPTPCSVAVQSSLAQPSLLADMKSSGYWTDGGIIGGTGQTIFKCFVSLTY